MRVYQKVLLAILVFVTGLYAGQMFHEMIGAQQALATLDDHTYIAYWQSLDKLMHVRMPFASNLVTPGKMAVYTIFTAPSTRALSFGLYALVGKPTVW